MQLLRSTPLRKIENRFISLVERTIKKSLRVRTTSYSRELPGNVRQQFGSKTYFVQLDKILTDLVILATRHADEMAGVAAAATSRPRNLTDEAVKASQDLASEVVESIIRILKDDAVYYESPAALAKRIQDLWGGERYRALRFARTFTADVAVTTELNRYLEHGLEYVQFEAKIDDRTSDQCRTLHGTVMRTDSAEARRLRPPLHHNCRSDLVPVAITTEIPEDLKYENRDFRDHVSQDFRQKYQTVDQKRVDNTLRKIDTFNDKYRIDKFVLDKDIEKRVAKEKGLSLPVSNPGDTPVKTDFVPATSIKEAEAWGQQNLGVRSVKYSGLSIDMANEVNRSILQFKQKFSGLQLDEIKTLKRTKYGNPSFVMQNVAYGKRSDITRNRLEINKAFFGQFNSLSELDTYAKKKADDGWWIPENFEQMIAHELGHTLTYQGITMAEAQAINRELSRFHFNGLSSYAKTNGAESIAESFAKYSRDGNLDGVTVIPRGDVKEIIKKYTDVDLS